jgi:hypothetical protein
MRNLLGGKAKNEVRRSAKTLLLVSHKAVGGGGPGSNCLMGVRCRDYL